MGLTDLINKAKFKLEESKIKSSEKSAQKKGFSSHAEFQLESMKVREKIMKKDKQKKRKEALNEIEQQTKDKLSGKKGMSPRMMQVDKGLKMFGSIIQPAPEPRGRKQDSNPFDFGGGSNDDPFGFQRTKKKRKSKKKSKKTKRRSKPKDQMGSFWKQFQ